MPGAAFKIIATYKQYTTPDGFFIQFFVMYSSFILVSTLLCTLLIIYRIFTVARAGGGAGSTLRAYRHVIEVLVESSALYSIVLILFTAFFALDDVTMIYFDALAGIARVRKPSPSIQILRSNRPCIGSCPDTPCWTCSGRPCSARRLLAGKRDIGLATFWDTTWTSESNELFYDGSYLR